MEIGPEDLLNTCALFHSRRAARAITAHFDRTLKPCGIKATQFSLLVAVSQAQGHTVSELASFMAMDRTALARDLRILENEGLVKIQVPASDRRTRLMKLTAKGVRVVDMALPHWRAAQGAVERAISSVAWPAVLDGMRTAIDLA